jgi:HK97 family phage portal protein
MKNLFRRLASGLSPARISVSQNKTVDDQAIDQKSTTQHSGNNVIALQQYLNARWSSTDYRSLANSGYMKNPIVHRCIRLIAETGASVPRIVKQGDKIITDSKVSKLLSTPNQRQSDKNFLEMLYGHLLVSGNGFIHGSFIDDLPQALSILRPDRVSVKAGNDGWPVGYQYGEGRKGFYAPIDENGHCSILHLSLFHPLDDHYGFPPLQAALMALDVHNAASQWNKSLLDNSARPSGALVYSSAENSNLSDEQFSRLKQELEEGYAGAKQAGRPLLLEGGLDWKSMGYSPRDMDFMQAKNGAARDIALAFGVPPMLLGIPGDNTYANYREANLAFWRQTVLPFVERTYGSLGHWLSKFYGEELKLTADVEKIEALSVERDQKWQRINQADFLTENEKRAAFGYPKKESLNE